MKHSQQQYTLITNSVQETHDFARSLAQKITHGIILLSGELGSGKTSFVQGFAKTIGIKQRIISPTFVIVRTYNVPFNKSGITHFHHIDLYRIEKESDLETIGMNDMLHDKHAILAIEWPEKLGSLFPRVYWQLTFKQVAEKKRKITGAYYDS